MTATVHVRAGRANARHAPLLRRAAAAALATTGAPQAEVTVVLTDEAGMRRLNERFAGQPRATDVLSFPSDARDPETGRPYLGDIVICLPTAWAQARQGGHALADELALLCIHGALHLLGYDHVKRKEKARMWAIQTEVLRSLGAQITSPAQVGR